MDIRNKTRQLYEDYCDLTGCRAALNVKDFVTLRREAIREMCAQPAATQKEEALISQQTPPMAQAASESISAPVRIPDMNKEASGSREKKTETVSSPMSDLDILRSIPDPWNN